MTNQPTNSIVDYNGDGVARVYSGTLVDLRNATADSLKMSDIAWGLGRQLRYNGHIRQDYTVAHHSLIMSYYVEPKYALEALLHDAAEAYLGDIIYPLKQIVPELEWVEDTLSGAIFKKFAPNVPLFKDHYYKSKAVAEADRLIYEHECYAFRDRPGTYHPAMQAAWRIAIEESNDLWHAPQYPFIMRYLELIGTELTREKRKEVMDTLEAEWFKPLLPWEVPEEVAADIEQSLAEGNAL